MIGPEDKNCSKNKTLNYQKFYDEESASKVKNIYEKDIEKFKYTFNEQ